MGVRARQPDNEEGQEKPRGVRGFERELER